MPSVSIIMPVYNSEKYLKTAIDSVLKQTFSDFELILINDGSTDLSGEICENYSKKDSRIILSHQKNGGICDARNKGLAIATGEYIAFIDNDDEFHSNLLEDNYKIAKNHDADIIKFGVHYIETLPGDQVKESKRSEFPKAIIKTADISLKYELVREADLLIHVWNGMYKRSTLIENNIKFDTRMRFGGEDTAFNYDVYPHINVLALNPRVYYKHIKRYNHSTSAKFNTNQIDALMINAYKEYGLFRELGIRELNPYYWSSLTAKYLISFLALISKKEYVLDNETKTKLIKEICNEEIFSSVIKQKNSNEIFKKSKRRGVILWLCEKEFYRILSLTPTFYNLLLKLRGRDK